MTLSKLTRKQTIAIGIILLVVIAAGGYFALVRGASQKYTAAVADRKNAMEQSARVPSLTADLRAVKRQHDRAEALLESYYRAKMPYISVADPVKALGRLWEEYGDDGTGPVLESWVRKTGNVSGTIQMPDVRNDPPPSDTKQVQVDLEKVAIVTKSFPKLLEFLRATGQMPRLGAIKKIKIVGSSPLLVAEIPMTVYLWTRDFTGEVGAPAATDTAQAGTESSPTTSAPQ